MTRWLLWLVVLAGCDRFVDLTPRDGARPPDAGILVGNDGVDFDVGPGDSVLGDAFVQDSAIAFDVGGFD